MMRGFYSLLMLCCCSVCLAQFNISTPQIDTLSFKITDTVFMAIDGNDDHSGSFNEPVRTFNAAIEKLPFGQEGVNGGNAYGLIMLKSGHYITDNGFHQFENRWKKGDTYRNVSIEGIGEVTIGSRPDSFANEHLLLLSGDHIYIRNIKLKYSSGIGILLSRNSEERQKHVLIENVIVDSVGSFSMLLGGVDTITVRNCRSLYASRPGNDQLSWPCSWPSGIKFFNSSDCIIHDCEIAYTRGEGLNFHNSSKAHAFQNQIHDNGLNIYNDNSSKLSISQNWVYNTPGLDVHYWRNCPADTPAIRAPRGLLIANEGACGRGNFPVFENCSTVCSFPTERFSNVDSMFVFNNIFQNVGSAFAFWQGTVDIGGRNCIRNVFIFNNTVIGSLHMDGAGSAGFVNAFFPNFNVLLNSFYGYLQNVRITHNIFTYDTSSDPLLEPVNLVFHPLHPGPKDISFDYNLWIEDSSHKGPNGEVRAGMPGSSELFNGSYKTIQPCSQQQEWVFQSAAAYSLLKNDYLGRIRNGLSTNVGALEFTSNCDSVVSAENETIEQLVNIFPNPCLNCKEVSLSGNEENTFETYQLLSFDGRVIDQGSLLESRVVVNGLPSGAYILILLGGKYIQTEKLIIY